MKKKLDLDERKMLERKNNQMKFYLREIDIDKNLSGSAESLSISSNVSAQHSTTEDKGSSKGEEFSASFVAQTNWTFVEKLLKVRRIMSKASFALQNFVSPIYLGVQDKNETNADGENRHGSRWKCRRRGKCSYHFTL